MDIKAGTLCPLCKKDHLKAYQKDSSVRYKGEVRTLKDLDVFRCGVCGEGFYSKESEDMLNKEKADLRRSVNSMKKLLHYLMGYFGFCWHIWNYFVDEDAAIHPSTRQCTKCYRIEVFHDGREPCCSKGSFSTGWRKLSERG